jgi:hypothetical protein
MKKSLLLAACGVAMTVVGCQNSGHSDVETTQTVQTTPGPAYTMSYQAVRDTEWASGTDAGAKRGTLRAGDRVMFAKAPNPSLTWQQAQLPDGSLQWVRPADFRAK